MKHPITDWVGRAKCKKVGWHSCICIRITCTQVTLSQCSIVRASLHPPPQVSRCKSRHCSTFRSKRQRGFERISQSLLCFLTLCSVTACLFHSLDFSHCMRIVQITGNHIDGNRYSLTHIHTNKLTNRYTQFGQARQSSKT